MSQATLKEVSGKEKELNVVMTMGQSLNNKCVEEDGTVIAKLLEELHAKWDHLNTLLTQRKVIHDNIITIVISIVVLDTAGRSLTNARPIPASI